MTTYTATSSANWGYFFTLFFMVSLVRTLVLWCLILSIQENHSLICKPTQASLFFSHCHGSNSESHRHEQKESRMTRRTAAGTTGSDSLLRTDIQACSSLVSCRPFPSDNRLLLYIDKWARNGMRNCQRAERDGDNNWTVKTKRILKIIN